MSKETYLEVDVGASDASALAAAEVFESVAETLRNSPEGKRCDFEIEVTER